jgi:putative redox protein
VKKKLKNTLNFGEIGMEAKIIQVSGITFVGKAASNHWVAIDGPEEFKGSNAAIRPKELVLIALGGCSGSDVASILAKMREPVIRFEIDLTAKVAPEHPKIFTQIEICYKFWGEDLKVANIEKAIHLSHDRYCSVTAMLKNAVDISYRYEINPQ